MWVCCVGTVSGTKITAGAYHYKDDISCDSMTDAPEDTISSAATVITTTAPIETTKTTTITTAPKSYCAAPNTVVAKAASDYAEPVAVSSTVEAKPLEPNFFFSVDDREFNASTLYESIILISYDKSVMRLKQRTL